MVHFFWQPIIFAFYDDVKPLSNYFAEYGLCNGGYYSIRWLPPIFIEIPFLCKYMPRIYDPPILLL